LRSSQSAEAAIPAAFATKKSAKTAVALAAPSRTIDQDVTSQPAPACQRA
jgi:hypothetical protein